MILLSLNLMKNLCLTWVLVTQHLLTNSGVHYRQYRKRWKLEIILRTQQLTQTFCIWVGMDLNPVHFHIHQGVLLRELAGSQMCSCPRCGRGIGLITDYFSP